MNTGTTTDTSVTALPIALNVNRKVELGEFGKGKYGNVMRELYHDTQAVFGFTKEQAHAVAERFGTDLGQVNAQVKGVKFGALKEGQRSLKDVVKSVKVFQTWAIRVAFVTSKLTELLKEDVKFEAVTFGVDTMEAIDAVANKLESV